VLLELAADALELGGICRQEPIEYEGLRERYLPELEFRGKAAHHHSHYALRAVPMVAAGVTPDLLEELGWQQTDDLWVWCLYSLVIYVRAAAERSDQSVAELLTRIADRRGVDLTAASRSLADPASADA